MDSTESMDYSRTALNTTDANNDLDVNVEEDILDEPASMGEHIHALATASFIRDYVWLRQGTRVGSLRFARIGFSMAIIAACLFLQIFLLNAVYNLLCKIGVQKIREDYSNYQLIMYGSDHAHLNENGFYRGDAKEFLDISKFDTLTSGEKHNVCQIPLAHPAYTFAILLVWTLTCIAELRRITDQIKSLIFQTPTVTDVDQVLQKVEDSNIAVEVVGLTLPMKIFITTFIMIPRLLSVAVLAFLGCRWLLSTNSLSDILLNSLALEFMLVLQELLYNTLVSKRNKSMTENTLIRGSPVGKLSCSSMLGSLLWACAAAGWVWLYIFHVQSVLPGYNWDVREVCSQWKPGEPQPGGHARQGKGGGGGGM